MATLRKSTYLKKSQVKAINDHIELFDLNIEKLDEHTEYLINLTSDKNAHALIKYFDDYDGSMNDFYDRAGL